MLLTLLTAFATAQDLYMVGVTLIAGAGPGVQISLFHISQLFPNHKNTVLSIIAGAFQLSFIVFLGFRHSLSFFRISFNTLCLLYCVPLLLLLFIGLVIWPASPFSLGSDDEIAPPPNGADVDRKMLVDVDDEEDDEEDEGRAPAAPSALQVLRSRPFITLLIWMTANLFWANFYVGTVVEQLFVKSGHVSSTTRVYSDIFNMLLPIGEPTLKQ